MPPNDSEKNEKVDLVGNTINDLSADVKGAKVLHVVPLLKILTSAQISVDTTPGGFANGGYADIHKGTMVCDDEGSSLKLVAVKVFRGAHFKTNTPQKRELYKNRLRREYEVWGRVEHRNILRLEGLLISDKIPSPGIVSEYKEHGDLLTFMQRGASFDRLAMARGIVCGLQYLHYKSVVHGDLTPPNVLVDSDRETGLPFPLITDFGKSRVEEVDGYTTNMNTTPMVARPPELLTHSDPEPATNKNALTPSSDVYSFSLVLLQLVTDKDPYSYNPEGKGVHALVTLIIDEQKPLRPTPNHYRLLNESHNFCWPIMQACWKHRPGDRITSKEVHERLCAGPTPLAQN